MSWSPSRPDGSCHVPEGELRRFSAGLDVDDGMRIESVTRVERPEGPVLRAVVVWIEDGRRVGAIFELPEEPVSERDRPLSPEPRDGGDVPATDHPSATSPRTASR